MIKSFFQTVKNYSIITIVFSAIMGIVLIAFPEQSIKYISIALGGVLILLGIICVIDYFARSHNAFLLTVGVIVAVAGIVVCVKYKTIISLVEFLFGLFILISGVFDLITSIEAVKTRRKSAIFTILMSVVAIVFGLVSVMRPFDVSTTLVRFIGAGLIVYAVLDIVSFFQFRNIEKAVNDAVNNNGEIVDEDARIVDED